MFFKAICGIGIAISAMTCFVTSAVAQSSSKESVLNGYVGGPYKVVAADFTGDRNIDVALGYQYLGVVTVERGDGKGQLSHLAVNGFAVVENREGKPHIEAGTEPHVHNLAHGDIDGDRLPDLAIAVGGKGPAWPGRILIVRNIGQGRFKKMIEYPTPSQAKGVQLADLNNDGRLDLLYTARGSGYKGDIAVGRLYVRQGLGEWKFGPALESDAGRSAYYVETADLNNDGFLDILIPNEHATTVTYFISPGEKIFMKRNSLSARVLRTSPIPGRRSHAVNDVRAADFNGDGNVDVLTANLGTSTISVFAGNGDGTFQKDSPFDGGKNCAFLAVGDLDNDGDLDFVVTHWTEDFVSVFLNDGQGHFSARKDYQAGLGNYGVTLCDVDRDGNLDVVTANYRDRSISLLKGIGNGTFRPAVTTPKALRGKNGKWIAQRKQP